jgi:hypothetical protein
MKEQHRGRVARGRRHVYPDESSWKPARWKHLREQVERTAKGAASRQLQLWKRQRPPRPEAAQVELMTSWAAQQHETVELAV